MPEFLRLLPPDAARDLWLKNIIAPLQSSELIRTEETLGRVAAEDVTAPHPLPEFERSTMDGYAVVARDTFGASDSLPAYLFLVGEVPMGSSPGFQLQAGQCALIHTGGMLPVGADAVVMLEHTQVADVRDDDSPSEIEILRAVAVGENLIRIGEDVTADQVILPRGTLLRPAEIGGLAALGILRLRVITKVMVGLISTGDEIVPASQRPGPGQVRDVNTHSLAALVEKNGGQVTRYGIVPDRLESLKDAAAQAMRDCDIAVIAAGSSASTRDMTATVIDGLGAPGVLVHGINTRPGKPTILGVCQGKAVLGLPGNPVSALVNGYLFLVPALEALLGRLPHVRPVLQARLKVNLSSQAGREDWWPVRLVLTNPAAETTAAPTSRNSAGLWEAEPIFSKSNLIFSLAAADGLLRIPADASGISAGEIVEVLLI